MNLKFQLPEKYYQPAEALCKMGHGFESRDLYLLLPEILDEDGVPYNNEEWRIAYSPNKTLFIVEEIHLNGKHDEFFTTKNPVVIDNFIKFLKIRRVLTSDAKDWMEESSTLSETWDQILHDLMKNVDLTEKDCKYLEIDPKRAKTLRRSSDLGLI